jgi:5-methyltetrahydropteroyltriglutamate--homocysteine methyltransferase
MVLSSVLGFPRIGEINLLTSVERRADRPLGANREVKKAVEAYWAGKLSADELTKVSNE